MLKLLQTKIRQIWNCSVKNGWITEIHYIETTVTRSTGLHCSTSFSIKLGRVTSWYTIIEEMTVQSFSNQIGLKIWVQEERKNNCSTLACYFFLHRSLSSTLIEWLLCLAWENVSNGRPKNYTWSAATYTHHTTIKIWLFYVCSICSQTSSYFWLCLLETQVQGYY